MTEVERLRGDLFSRFGEHLERATAADFVEILEKEMGRLSLRFNLPEPPDDLGTEGLDKNSQRLYLNATLANVLRAMRSVPPQEVLMFMFFGLVGAMLPDKADNA